MRQIPLKQHNTGRKGGEPDAIVIHWSAGSGDEIKLGEYFQRHPERDASYHRGIGRAGGTAEYVDTANTAWHAGDGVPWDDAPGRPGRKINARSVGICLTLLGPVSRAWSKLHPERTLAATHRKRAIRGTLWERPTPEQVTALRAMLIELKAKHPSIRWVVGHADVTAGKQDPGPILDGVDLGLEALGLRWLRRRWDLPGAPWEGAEGAPAPTPAPADRAPQGPASEPERAPEVEPDVELLPDLPEALPDPPAEERIERPAGELAAIAEALGEAAARGASLIRLAQAQPAEDDLPDLPAPLGDAGERPAPAPARTPAAGAHRGAGADGPLAAASLQTEEVLMSPHPPTLELVSRLEGECEEAVARVVEAAARHLDHPGPSTPHALTAYREQLVNQCDRLCALLLRLPDHRRYRARYHGDFGRFLAEWPDLFADPADFPSLRAILQAWDAPVTAPQTPADAAARAQGREPSRSAKRREAREAAKAAGVVVADAVAAPAGDSATTGHAVPEDQEGEPGAVS